jgi:hypothetical protein
MKRDLIPSLTALAALVWATVLCLSNPVLAAESAAIPQVSQSASKAPPVADSTAKTANARRATTGPGTQTEDDIYVGAKKKTKVLRKPSAASGGDDDLDELEVERRAVKKK